MSHLGKFITPEYPRRGDIVFAKSDRLASRFIRFVDGGDFSHVAFALGDGFVVEATARGVVRQRMDSEDWRGVAWRAVAPKMDAEDREDAIAHAEWMGLSGYDYAWITLFGMWLYWLTGGRLAISGGAKAFICSALVSDSLHAGGMRFPKHSLFMTPSDLQRHFGLGGDGG